MEVVAQLGWREELLTQEFNSRIAFAHSILSSAVRTAEASTAVEASASTAAEAQTEFANEATKDGRRGRGARRGGGGGAENVVVKGANERESE